MGRVEVERKESWRRRNKQSDKEFAVFVSPLLSLLSLHFFSSSPSLLLRFFVPRLDLLALLLSVPRFYSVSVLTYISSWAPNRCPTRSGPPSPVRTSTPYYPDIG